MIGHVGCDAKFTQVKSVANLKPSNASILINFLILMAFPQPNAQRELANRKILEDLQLKKQLLLKQGVVSTLNSSALPVLGTSNVQQADGHSMSSVQRGALQSANSQSTGFFISQDSSFGNFILPVLPRFETNTPAK